MNMQSKQKILLDKEVQQLLLYIKNQADSARKRGTSRAIIDELIIFFLLKAGLRPDELCKLQIKDLPVIHGEQFIWIRNGKEIIRKVLISKYFVELLSRFVALYRQKANQKDFLLQSERGNPISYMSLYNKVRRIGLLSGICNLSPAVLRHTYVMRLYDDEQDLRYVQEQAGYTNCRTLYKYVKDSSIQTTQRCEACRAEITQGDGKIIESGQLICRECQKYFRRS